MNITISQPFVGRRAELTFLHKLWAATRLRQPHVVGITGPPAVGKSTLMGRFADGLESTAVVTAVCTPGGRHERWGVLRQIARALPRPGPVRSPMLQALRAGDEPDHAGEALLSDLMFAGEVIVVVDDAQWADLESIRALEFVGRHMSAVPVLLVLIQNDDHPLDEGRRRMLEQPNGRNLVLGGLSPEELITLAVQVGRPGLCPEGAARLHEHTGGNPFHVRSILDQVPLRAIIEDLGRLAAHDSLAASVAVLYGCCAADTRRLVAAGAVLGGTFSVPHAQLVSGLASVAVELDQACRAGLIREVPGTGGREFAFVSPSVRTVVHDGLTETLRRELHLRAATFAGRPEASQHQAPAGEAAEPAAADRELAA